MLKKNILIPLLFIFCLPACFAQQFEMGLGIGATHYKGDIYPNFKPFAFNGASNAFVKLNLVRMGISLKGSGTAGFLSAKDSRVNSLFHQQRGFNFTTNFWEAGGQLEYNFFHFRSSHLNNSDWTPYIFGGYNFYSVYNSEYTVDFDPSSTNFWFSQYGTTYIDGRSDRSVPFGVGFKLMLTRRLNLTAEFGARKTFRDTMIDNFGYKQDLPPNEDKIVPNFDQSAALSQIIAERRVATPGTYKKDMYYYTSVSVSYVFGGIVCPPGYKVPLLKRMFN